MVAASSVRRSEPPEKRLTLGGRSGVRAQARKARIINCDASAHSVGWLDQMHDSVFDRIERRHERK